MSFFSGIFRRRSKYEKFLKDYSTKRQFEKLFEQKGIGAAVAYSFVFFTFPLSDSAKDLNKFLKGTSSEVLGFELIWFDFFSIAVQFDTELKAGDPNFSNTVLGGELFADVYKNLIEIFIGFSKFETEASLERLNAYIPKGKEHLSQEFLATTLYQFLIADYGCVYPASEPSLENVFKLDILKTGQLMAYPAMRSKAMHPHLKRAISRSLEHFGKKDLLYKKSIKSRGLSLVPEE